MLILTFVAAEDRVLACALGILVPLKCNLSIVTHVSMLSHATQKEHVTLAPAGMVTVDALEPERPPTLHVKFVLVKSSTGSWVGGKRIAVCNPWSTCPVHTRKQR